MRDRLAESLELSRTNTQKLARLNALKAKIKEKLKPHTAITNNIDFHGARYQEAQPLLHYLLEIAGKYNLVDEFKELLSLNWFGSINQPLQIKPIIPMGVYAQGLTLLGLVSHHGHLNLVSYLVEKRKADVNAQDAEGNTALHQVIYGDLTFPNLISNDQHAEVARYLLDHKANTALTNKKGHTPLERLNDLAPTKLESFLGTRILPGQLYGDRVRPVIYPQQKLEPRRKNQALSGLLLFTLVGALKEDWTVGLLALLAVMAVHRYLGHYPAVTLFKPLESMNKSKPQSSSSSLTAELKGNKI